MFLFAHHHIFSALFSHFPGDAPAGLMGCPDSHLGFPGVREARLTSQLYHNVYVSTWGKNVSLSCFWLFLFVLFCFKI